MSRETAIRRMPVKITILLLVLTAPVAAFAQDLPDRPMPKTFDVLTAATFAAAATDSVQTVFAARAGAVEVDPLARPFTQLPTPAYLMVSETLPTGCALLARKMHHSNNRALRRLWWLPQTIELGANVWGITSTWAHGYR
jgi:hypothetical protein